jgi:hypothetical protein
MDEQSQRMESMQITLNRHSGRLDNIDGQLYESRYQALSRVGQRYRRAQRVYIGDIDEVMDARDDGRLPVDDVKRLGQSDFIVRARNGRGADAPFIYVVIEVSNTIHNSDVERADARAATLRSVGLDAVPWVGGKSIGDATAELAERLGVEVILDPEESHAA